MANFFGTAGNDNLIGADGVADTFVFGASELSGNDTVSGGRGGSIIDTLRLRDGGAVTAAQFAHVGGIERLQLSNLGNDVTLSNALVGGSENDILTVQGSGFGGDDTIDASGLFKTNRVVFSTGLGNDALAGGGGADTFRFSNTQLTGADALHGNAGNDTLEITTGGSMAAAFGANIQSVEIIRLSQSGNKVSIGADFGTSATVRVFGGAGNDIVSSLKSMEVVSGGGGDLLTGSNASDNFIFTAANLTAADKVNGRLGTDTLAFSDGGAIAAATLAGVKSIERIEFSDAGNSIVIDAAFEANNSKQLTIVGMAGNDSVDAGGSTLGVHFAAWGGEDSFTGGTGDDVYTAKIAALSFGDSFAAGAGSDELVVSGLGSINSIGVLGDFTGLDVITVAGDDDFSIGLADPFIASTDQNAITVNGGGGGDHVSANVVSTGKVAFFAGAGDDLMDMGNSDELFDGGDGIDLAVYTPLSAAGPLHIDLRLVGPQDTGAGSDTLIGVENVALDSGAGTLIGNSVANQLTGGKGRDSILGGAGNDTISASLGDDTLRGQDGDDVMTGGGGRDLLFGGDGADSFIYQRTQDSGVGAGRDIITGFLQGADAIDLSAIGQVFGEDDIVFDFIGGDGFSGTGSELRQTQNAADTILQGDADGNGAVDFEILVRTLINFSAEDFVL